MAVRDGLRILLFKGTSPQIVGGRIESQTHGGMAWGFFESAFELWQLCRFGIPNGQYSTPVPWWLVVGSFQLLHTNGHFVFSSVKK